VFDYEVSSGFLDFISKVCFSTLKEKVNSMSEKEIYGASFSQKVK
jgi:hypothetical protein